MKEFERDRYRGFLRRVIGMAGISADSPQAFSFRVAVGTKERIHTGWIRVPRSVVEGFLKEKSTRALASEVENLVETLMSAGRAVARLVRESEDALFHLLETHVGRGLKPRSCKRQSPRTAKGLRERAGISVVRSEGQQTASGEIVSLDVARLRSRRFLALEHEGTGRMLGFVDLAWDHTQRAKARRQLGFMRYRHGLSLDQEERCLRRAVVELEGRIRELENLLRYGVTPYEVSEMLALQRELDGALYWRATFRVQADEARRARHEIEFGGIRLVS